MPNSSREQVWSKFYLLESNHFGFFSQFPLGYSRKNPNRGVEDNEFSRGIEKQECENSRGRLKKKWNFQG